jgi:hypothetical protein
MIEVNVKEAVEGLTKGVGLSKSQIEKAATRSINRAIDAGRTAGSRELRKVYNIKARDVSDAISITKSYEGNMVGKLNVSGKPIPVKVFSARQTKAGVMVRIKKGRGKLIRSAFLATMASGHVGVFARGKYAGGQFQWRKQSSKNRRAMSATGKKNWGDLTINELTTISLPRSFGQEPVVKAVAMRMEQVFNDRMKHEVDRMVARQK